jgi:hypothetical protein
MLALGCTAEGIATTTPTSTPKVEGDGASLELPRATTALRHSIEAATPISVRPSFAAP